MPTVVDGCHVITTTPDGSTAWVTCASPYEAQQLAASMVIPAGVMPVTVTTNWRAATSRLTCTFTSTAAVVLWRTIGGRTGAFALTPGVQSVRAFQAVPRDRWEFRLTDAAGPAIAQGIVP